MYGTVHSQFYYTVYSWNLFFLRLSPRKVAVRSARGATDARASAASQKRMGQSMTDPHPPGSGPRDNLLLAGLPEEAYERLAPDLQPVELARGQLLSDPTAEPDRFYFITAGVVSLLYHTANGSSAELAVVGHEGGAGLSVAMGGHVFPADEVVQVPGFAWTLRAEPLRREFDRGGELQRNLLRFSQVLMAQMAQTVVCNRHHSVEQQLVRWVLLSLDRLHGDDLQMTQEAIAHMLGVRRAGVTEAAGQLQRKGAIEYTRGRIHVPDRAALEALACECYRVVKVEYEHLTREAAGG